MLKKKKRRENSNIQDETVTTETAKFKQPKVLVDVKYSVFEMSHGYSCDTLKGKSVSGYFVSLLINTERFNIDEITYFFHKLLVLFTFLYLF